MLVKRSNATRDILLVSEEAVKELAGIILTTKSVGLQTEYMGIQKTRVTLHRVIMVIIGELSFQIWTCRNVSPVISKAGIATGYFVL